MVMRGVIVLSEYRADTTGEMPIGLEIYKKGRNAGVIRADLVEIYCFVYLYIRGA